MDWYNFSKKLINPLMNSRSKILDLIHQGSFSVEQAKTMAKDTRNDLKEGILQVKANWSSHLANRTHDLANYPKDAWKVVNTLKESIQCHHKTPDSMRLIKEDGSFTSSDEEIIEVWANKLEKSTIVMLKSIGL